MLLIPTGTESEEYGWALSKAMWALSVPRGGNTTLYYCGVRTHPQTGEIYLAMDEEDAQPVHRQADVQPLVDMLTVASGAEREALTSQLEAARGGRVRPLDLVPQDLVDRALEALPEPNEEQTEIPEEEI